MPRTPRKKEIKKVEIIEDVKEPEPEEEEAETEQVPTNDAYYYSKDKTPEPEQHPSSDEELQIPKKRPKQRTEKQLEQLRLAREKSLANKELRRKQKEEAEEAVKRELESKI